MADVIRPATIEDFKSFVGQNFSPEYAARVHSAAVLFVETVMAGEMRKRIKIRKDQMAHGKSEGKSSLDAFDYDMEDRLAGVLRFADVVTSVFTVPAQPASELPEQGYAKKKRKKKAE